MGEENEEMIKYVSTESLSSWLNNIRNSDASEDKKDDALYKAYDLLSRDVEAFKKIEPSIEAASFIHEVVDKDISSMEVARKPSCMAGCSYCCYIDVGCTPIEVDLILDYVEKNQIQIEWRSNLSGKACPFLLDGKCSVYEVRPGACRLYHVVSEPKYCDTEVYEFAMRSIYPIGEISYSAALTAFGYVDLRGALKAKVENEGK